MPYRHLDASLRDRALVLVAEGSLSRRAIARELEVHHTTIAWWLSGGGASSGETREGADAQRDAIRPWQEPRLRPTWAYLFGMYLGDGYIDPLGRLRIFCDKKYPGIIDEVDGALRRVGVTRPWHINHANSGCREILTGDYGWSAHLPTGSGPKHTYQLMLGDWHHQAIARHPHLVMRGLIQSDGCRFLNRVPNRRGGHYVYASYDFSNVSTDVHAVFEACAAHLGVSHTTYRGGRARRIARREHVALLDLFVGPKR